MSYKDNNFNFIGCLFYGFIALAIIVSGIRGCVNGDIKLPKLGSHKVGGGSGGIGTSNGYNVQNENTTSPNFNSSTNDYRNTNQLPTEYKKGNSLSITSNSGYRTHTSQSTPQTVPSSSYSNTVSSTQNIHNTTISSSPISSSPSLSTTQSNLKNPSIYDQPQQSITHSASSTATRVTCSRCGGSGQKKTYYRFEAYGGNFKCAYCSRTDAHGHEQWKQCPVCFGKGYEVYESCSHCKGTGYEYDMYGNKQQCFYFLGKGKSKRLGL